MNDFQIERTTTFDESLLEIAISIAMNFDKDVMDNCMDKIKEQISKLTNPDIGSNKFPTLSRKGYRVLVIPHNYVIYTVDYMKKKVMLRLIVDDRQELYNVLEQYSLL